MHTWSLPPAADCVAMSARHHQHPVPPWATIPPQGMYLIGTKQGKEVDRVKFDKIMTRLGRNKDVCEAPQDHLSISRVHVALFWHGEQQRPYIEDLGSVHGTFLFDHTRLKIYTPYPMRLGTSFRLGASSRQFSVVLDPERARLDAQQQRVAKRKFLHAEAQQAAAAAAAAAAGRALKTPKVQFAVGAAPGAAVCEAGQGAGGKFAGMVSSTIVKGAAAGKLPPKKKGRGALPRAQRGAGARLARLMQARAGGKPGPASSGSGSVAPDIGTMGTGAAGAVRAAQSATLLKFLPASPTGRPATAAATQGQADTTLGAGQVSQGQQTPLPTAALAPAVTPTTLGPVGTPVALASAAVSPIDTTLPPPALKMRSPAVASTNDRGGPAAPVIQESADAAPATLGEEDDMFSRAL